MGARNERGAVLIVAVVAMLIMGALGAALALFADLESRAGVSYTDQAQAEALAEAGLEVARDAVRTAAREPRGFTGWFDGRAASHMLATGAPLGAGRYWARIDNDCGSLTVVPAAVEEPQPAGAACSNALDRNATAVITAWATAGTGRARVRAVVSVDSPWKHACAEAQPERAGPCGAFGEPSSSPAVTPADPSDPNGPAAYDDLPRPILGCSRIDPTMHGADWGRCPPASPTLSPYPSAALPPGFRPVLMGEDSAAGGQPCNADPANPAIRYFGYFDCALSTPCEPAAACPAGQETKGCVKAGDSRATADPGRYAAASPTCPGGATPATGLVFNYYGAPGRLAASRPDLRNPVLGGLGTGGGGVTLYVLRRGSDGQTTVRGTVHGTLVVEGNGSPGCGAATRAVDLGDDGRLATGRSAYGYPLALLLYDPSQPAPPGPPVGRAPQSTCAGLGGRGARIDGLVYSGGRVRLDAITVSGSVIAVETEAPGGPRVQLSYSAAFGDGAPPPGFPQGPGNRVVVVRKSLRACASYRDESGGATPCN